MSDGKSSSEHDPIEKVKEAIEEPLVVLWDRIEEWQQDNHYIRSGYRPASNSYARSASSLGYLHNESINIWSHLIGALIFAFGSSIAYIVLRPRYHTATQEDVFVFSCFFLGAVMCMGMSATYHTISNHSKAVSRYGNQLDYLGIVCLIWVRCSLLKRRDTPSDPKKHLLITHVQGSFIPSIHYGFSCEPRLVTTYWTMISTIGAGCGIVTMAPQFATPKYRPFRALMFAAMGLSAIYPVIHGLRLYGTARMVKLIGLPWLVAQGIMYLLGASIYAARVPEKFDPGRFDIWGSSHQIFHLFVVAAAITHLYGLFKAFDFHHSDAFPAVCR